MYTECVYYYLHAGVMELVDVVDSKSTASDGVPVRVRPPAPRWSKLYVACSDFFQKSERVHFAAPPLQIEPAWLGFGLVLAANLKAAASIVLRCYKTILYKPLFLRSWLCGNSLYETEIGRIPKIERLSRMAEPFGFFISCFRR